MTREFPYGDVISRLQAEWAAEVISPLGDDLLLRSMTATEGLGRMARYELELLSPDANLSLNSMLGLNLSVRLDRELGEPRYFDGFVCEFSQAGMAGNYHRYTAVLRPWLWFLSRTSDCRIFQKQTVPQIIRSVFESHKWADYDTALFGDYPELEYCVQYRETDLAFVTRLMEHAGLYFRLRHGLRQHTVVLCDSQSSHDPSPGFESLPYKVNPEVGGEAPVCISEWLPSQHIQPTRYTVRDFDFERPRQPVESATAAREPHEGVTFTRKSQVSLDETGDAAPASRGLEVFDYGGSLVNVAESDPARRASLIREHGDLLARRRMERFQCEFEQARGVTNARGLSAGDLFKLTNHPREDQERDYLVVATEYHLRVNEIETTGGEDAEFEFECRFRAVPAATAYRLSGVTPKPVIQGPQTAIVVGSDADEIHTDKHGRVKVQFHWDRYGKGDQESSCWIRVAQAWAGSGWGAQYLPRVGQEVVVEFLDGDPDKPIVTGGVYNGAQRTPYALPTNKTQSGIRSRSSKGGTLNNFNEILFEDKAGAELLSMQAEKDRKLLVKNDNVETIGNDETIQISRDRTLSVGQHSTCNVAKNRTTTVGETDDIHVNGNRKLTVDKDYQETVDGHKVEHVTWTSHEVVNAAKTVNVGAGYAVNVGAALNEIVVGARIEEIGAWRGETIVGKKTVEVGADYVEDVTGNLRTTVQKDVVLNVTGGLQQNVTKDVKQIAKKNIELEAKKTLVLEAKDKIVLRCGRSEITLSSGEIDIKSPMVKINC
ncbi:MAG: type VI secretion system tip protein TssI/VgrG [Pseudomonadota bacterium]